MSLEDKILNYEQRVLLQKVADYIVKKKLTPAALFALETSKPFSFIGNQIMAFFQPMVDVFISTREYNLIMDMLDKRESIELFMRMIEDTEKNLNERGEEYGKS